MLNQLRYRHRLCLKIVSLAVVCLFILNDIAFGLDIKNSTANSTLAPWAGIESPIVRRDMMRMGLEKRFSFVSAETPQELRLLAINHTNILIDSDKDGNLRYILSREAAYDDLLFLKSFVREEVRAIMRIMASEDETRYKAVKNLILSQNNLLTAYHKLPGRRLSGPSEDTLTNDIIARAFEIITLKDQKLITNEEITAEENNFLNIIEPVVIRHKSDYFTGEFWNSGIIEQKIGLARAKLVSNGIVRSGMTYEREMLAFVPSAVKVPKAGDSSARSLQFHNAVLALKATAEDGPAGYNARAEKAVEQIANYKKSGQSLILYADDLLENAAVMDLESTIKDILPNNVLDDGKIVLYARVPANASILEEMIKRADPDLGVLKLTPGDIKGKNVIGDDEYDEIEAIVELSKARNVKGILGIIRKPLLLKTLKDKKELNYIYEYSKAKKIPIIFIGAEKGIYSFARAISAAIKAKNTPDNKDWLILLAPVRSWSEEIAREYSDYQKSLAARQAA